MPDEVVKVVALHHQPGRAFALGGNIALGVALLRWPTRSSFKFVVTASWTKAT